MFVQLKFALANYLILSHVRKSITENGARIKPLRKSAILIAGFPLHINLRNENFQVGV